LKSRLILSRLPAKWAQLDYWREKTQLLPTKAGQLKQSMSNEKLAPIRTM
jgi:hypothetical protein